MRDSEDICLSLINMPTLIKIEPLPNKFKQTRKRVVFRDDSINSFNSQSDINMNG